MKGLVDLRALFRKATPPARHVDALPDFTGKTVVVYGSSEEIARGYYQEVRVVSVGFNVFVVGRRVDPEPMESACWAGADLWISINHIAQRIVFDDLESARQAFHRGEESDTSRAVEQPPTATTEAVS